MAQSPKVLIVGSGPAGLTLALSLLKNGVEVRVIEKDAQHHTGERGPGIQPRTLETHRYLGVLDDIQKIASPVPTVKIYDPSDPHRILKSEALVQHIESTPDFPIVTPLMLGQYRHQAVLRKHVESLGGKVDLGVALVNLHQDEQSVTIELSQTVDGKETVVKEKYDWVVGMDGAHSAVRKALGVSFVGDTRKDEKLYIVDCKVEGLAEDGRHLWGSMNTAAVSLRYTGVPMTFQTIFGGPQVDFASLGTKELQKVQSVLNGISKRTDIKLLEIVWQGEWRPNIRMAERFRVGRVFIGGDAAHVHSPAGGQGLNTSVMDAFNLGWKLALVIKGVASPKLLESYEVERLPVVADMLKISTELHFRKFLPGSQEAEALERAIASTASGAQRDENRQFFTSRKLYQLDLNYRWSSIVFDERFEGSSELEQINAYGTEGDDVRAGDRAPDASSLLVVAQARKLKFKEGENTRFFDVFAPDLHTVMVFAPSLVSSSALAESAFSAAKDNLHGLHRSVLVLTSHVSADEALPKTSNVDIALKDTEGHAFRGYGLPEDAATIVIVRPDGVVGAFTKGVEGMNRYFALVLGK